MGPVLNPPPRRPSTTAAAAASPLPLAQPPPPRHPAPPPPATVEEAADELRGFIRCQVAVTRRMSAVRPPPTREELRMHAARVAKQARRIAAGAGAEAAYAVAVESAVARRIAGAATVGALEAAVAAALQYCDGQSGELAEAGVDAAAVVGAGGDVCAAVERLWALDVNRLTPGVDYELDLQGRSWGREVDAAPRPLFARVDEAVWKRPTFAAFYPLLGHYCAHTGVEERVGRAEVDEQRAFLDAVCATPCMRFAHAWLAGAGKIRVRDGGEFKEMLSEVWFGLYARDGCRDSSAFEHVFAGEVDGGRVKGMHSFLQLYKEERAGTFDYKGYLLPRRGGGGGGGGGSLSAPRPSAASHLLTIRFDWLGVTKAASTVLMGVSPEYELALYTMLFVAGGQENSVRLGGHPARVTVHARGNKIGSCYPEAVEASGDEALAEAAVAVQSAFRRRCTSASRWRPKAAD